MVLCAWTATLVFVLLCNALGQEVDPFVGRDITVVLKLNPSTAAPNAQVPKEVRLGTKSIGVDGQLDFRGLLKKNGVLPNGDSLGLIYDLNPSVSDLSQIKAGQIVIPAALGVGAATAVEEGFLLEIRTDTILKDDLLASDQMIRAMALRLREVNDSYFGTPENTTQIKAEISNVAESLADIALAIHDKLIAFPREVLVQLHLETDVFRSILAEMLGGPMSVTSAVKTRLAAIGDDFNIKRRGFGEERGINAPPMRWPSVSVVVRTLKAGQVEVSDYRIHYVPEALLNVPGTESKFGRLSSPAEASLPEANYRIWASFREDSKRTSEELDIKVRDDGSKQIYELTITD